MQLTTRIYSCKNAIRKFSIKPCEKKYTHVQMQHHNEIRLKRRALKYRLP